MPSDPPDGPYDGYEGPAAFADLGDGYPVELGPDKFDADPPSPADDEDGDAPLTPVNARRLLHPLPPAPASDDDWDEFEPARTDWRKLIPPTFTLAAAISLGTWLAIVPKGQQVTEPSEPPSYAQHTPQTFQPGPTDPSTTRTPASQRRSTATKPSASPTPSTKKPSRRASSRPTTTVTKTVSTTATATATRTRTPRHEGPEEPPGTLFSPACLTWAECHDEPPRGNR